MSCALGVDGALSCWGVMEADIQKEVLDVSTPEGSFLQVSAGVNHNCAVDESTRLQCWGDNTSGQAFPP